MTEDAKQKLKDFIDSSLVISDFLSQQVRNGVITQLLYKKNIQQFVETLDQLMEIQDEWK